MTPALFENMLLLWPVESFGEVGSSDSSGGFSPLGSGDVAIASSMVICKGDSPLLPLWRRCGAEEAASSVTLEVER